MRLGCRRRTVVIIGAIAFVTAFATAITAPTILILATAGFIDMAIDSKHLELIVRGYTTMSALLFMPSAIIPIIPA